MQEALHIQLHQARWSLIEEQHLDVPSPLLSFLRLGC
jgi:hypothetical protein